MTNAPYFNAESLYEHKGGHFDKLFTPENCWEEIERFESRSTDVWVVSYGRSGSHWMRRIVDLVLGNDGADEISATTFEINGSAIFGHDTPPRMGYQLYAAQPSDRTRVISSHLPVHHLPKSVLETKGVKIIYIMRNPFDVYRSAFEYLQHILPPDVDFSSYVKFVIRFRHYGGWCENVRGYWERRNEDILHIIHYEDLVKDFKTSVRSLAIFLGRPLSDEQLINVQERSSIKAMKDGETPMDPSKFKFAFGRIANKGEIRGGTEFSDEDRALVTSYIKENLAGTSIRYLQEIMQT